MTVLITGAAGQLGSELCRQMGDRAVGVDRHQLDITDREAVRYAILKARPQVVINAAAYTKVDLAESEPEICRLVNATAAGHLREACDEAAARLVEISTDYLFGGRYGSSRPHREDEPLVAQGAYARSKLEAEQLVGRNGPHLIVRTCGLYGHPRRWHAGPNFVDTMLRLGGQGKPLRVVDDQRVSPSYVVEVARAIRHLVASGAQGVFHVANAGPVSWFDFACEIFRLRGLSVTVTPISTADYGAPAPRPSDSALDCAKYHATGGPPLSDWRAALAAYLSAAEPPPV